MAGFEPAPQGLEGPQAAVTPHSLWFGLRVSKTPPVRRWWATWDATLHTRPNVDRVVHRPIDETVTLSATSLSTCWRQRQDSNPDPRVLEARMLPLHHAADVISRLDCRETEPPANLARSLRGLEAKTKKAF